MIVLVVGGFSRSLINFRGHLLQSMAAAGHEVHAAAPGLLADQTTASGLRAIGVTPHDVAIQRVGLNPLKDLGALASLLRLMREVGPDAVLAYTAKPVIWSMLAGALTGIPKRFALITGAGYAFGSATSGKRALISKIARSLYRYGLACASQVFFQNRDDAALFADLRLVPKSTPTAIFAGSGIDPAHCAAARRQGHPRVLLGRTNGIGRAPGSSLRAGRPARRESRWDFAARARRHAVA